MAALLLTAGALLTAQPLVAKGCLEGSPAQPPPPALWDELLNPAIITYQWIALAAVAGILLGIPLARVPLTAVPF